LKKKTFLEININKKFREIDSFLISRVFGLDFLKKFLAHRDEIKI